MPGKVKESHTEAYKAGSYKVDEVEVQVVGVTEHGLEVARVDHQDVDGSGAEAQDADSVGWEAGQGGGLDVLEVIDLTVADLRPAGGDLELVDPGEDEPVEDEAAELDDAVAGLRGSLVRSRVYPGADVVGRWLSAWIRHSLENQRGT